MKQQWPAQELSILAGKIATPVNAALYVKDSIVRTLPIILLLLSFSVSSHEYENTCGITEKDVKDAKSTTVTIGKYLRLLQGISSRSFKGKNISGESAASLMEEKQNLERKLKKVMLSAERIHRKSTNCSVVEWQVISENISTSIRLMDDMERFNLIESCELCFIEAVTLNTAHDNINIKHSELIN